MDGERTSVFDNDGREIYVYPSGDRFYADEIRAMLAGAEGRRGQPLKVDDLDELRARLASRRSGQEA